MFLQLPATLQRRSAIACVVWVLAACASAPPATPQEQVRARAQARWDAYIAGRFEQAYAYLSPASRAMLPYQRWRGAIGNLTTWKSAEVDTVTCETSDKCIVRVKVQHEPLLLRGKLGTISTALDETWLIDEGQWWLMHAR